MHRTVSERSLVEALLPERLGRNERLDEVVDWK